MATFAPYSANLTAIACPMPDVPPVTSTPLPFKPGIASRRAAVVAVADICPSSSSVWSGLVARTAAALPEDSDQLELAGPGDSLLTARRPPLAKDAPRVGLDRV